MEVGSAEVGSAEVGLMDVGSADVGSSEVALGADDAVTTASGTVALDWMIELDAAGTEETTSTGSDERVEDKAEDTEMGGG